MHKTRESLDAQQAINFENGVKKQRKAVTTTFYHLIDFKGIHFIRRTFPSPVLSQSMKCVHILKCRIVPKREPLSGMIFGENDSDSPVIGRSYYTTTGRVVEVLSFKEYSNI